MERFPPEAMLKILKLPWLPLIVNEEAPCPVIVRAPALEVAAIVGSAACRVMVVPAPFVNSEEAKIITSLAEVALAASIASLKEVTPSPELTVSAMVVTVNCELLLLAPSKAPMLGAMLLFVFNKTLVLLEPKFAVMMSSLPSTFTSPNVTELG